MTIYRGQFVAMTDELLPSSSELNSVKVTIQDNKYLSIEKCTLAHIRIKSNCNICFDFNQKPDKEIVILKHN